MIFGTEQLIAWTILWMICAIFNYGATFALFRGINGLVSDRRFSLKMAAWGPLATIPVLLNVERLRYGWRLR